MRKVSLAEWAAHLEAAAAKVHLTAHESLKLSAPELAREAQGLLGQYQRENMGPFPGWKELADATKEDRKHQGYPENEPLLRSGDMRDSIESHVEGLKLTIGSDSKIALYQEMGTPDAQHPIPPRPFLSLTINRRYQPVTHAAMHSVMHMIAGQKSIKGVRHD